MKFNFHQFSCMRSNIHTNYVHKLTLCEVMFRVKIKVHGINENRDCISLFHSYHVISVCMDELLQIASMYGEQLPMHDIYIAIIFA